MKKFPARKTGKTRSSHARVKSCGQPQDFLSSVDTPGRVHARGIFNLKEDAMVVREWRTEFEKMGVEQLTDVVRGAALLEKVDVIRREYAHTGIFVLGAIAAEVLSNRMAAALSGEAVR